MQKVILSDAAVRQVVIPIAVWHIPVNLRNEDDYLVNSLRRSTTTTRPIGECSRGTTLRARRCPRAVSTLLSVNSASR